MALPPGIPFLCQLLVALSVIPVCIYSLGSIISTFYFHAAIPTWFLGLSFASTPLSFIAHVLHRRWTDRRNAARLGTILPPEFVGKKIGNIDLMQEMGHNLKHGYPADFAWSKFNKLGNTFRMSMLWGNAYITCDPNVIKSVLATDFTNYEKGTLLNQLLYSLLGTGVFNSDGDMWKWHRSMTRPFFSKDRISHFELFDRHAKDALVKMSERFGTGYAVDFQDLIARFTLDSATEFLFGTCVHSLHTPLPFPHNHSVQFASSGDADGQAQFSRAEAFADAIREAQFIAAERTNLGEVWPLFEMRRNKTDKFMRVVDDFLDPILKEALKKKKLRANEGEDPPSEAAGSDEETLLDNLLRYTTDPVVLHDEVLNIMIAGRDTTASTLTTAVYFLCMYPDVLQRLRAEILANVGPDRPPTYADIKEMRYLRAVINETLRLYPPVPGNIRVSIKEGTIPNSSPDEKPFYVPPKTPIIYSVFVMHRRPEYWGPDADEFDPDRFLDERLHKYLTPNPFIFLPFNAGPRICLGQQFAYNEISFFLVKLLQRFSSMELAPDAAPPGSLPPAEWATSETSWSRKGIEKFWPKSHLTLSSEGGLWVRMTEADEGNGSETA